DNARVRITELRGALDRVRVTKSLSGWSVPSQDLLRLPRFSSLGPSRASPLAQSMAALRGQKAERELRREAENRKPRPASHWVSRQEGSLGRAGLGPVDRRLECRLPAECRQGLG